MPLKQAKHWLGSRPAAAKSWLAPPTNGSHLGHTNTHSVWQSLLSNTKLYD